MTTAIAPDAAEMLPDYGGGSILNLIASIGRACGGRFLDYARLSLVPEASFARTQRLLLIVIDGLGDALLREAGQGTHLAAHRVGGLTSVFPSTTAAAVTTLMTGLAPAAHGLTGWHMLFEEAGGVLAVLPLRRRAPPVAGTEAGMEADAPRAEVPPPERLFAHTGLFAGLGRASRVLSPADIAFSPFNLHHTRGAAVQGYADREDLFAQLAGLAANGARSAAPNFTYAYYDGLDALSHRHGAYGDAACAELFALDAAFARLLDALAGSDTTVVVTADHGFIDSPPEHWLDLAEFPHLAALLEQPLCGEPRVAYCYVRPGQGEAFEAAAAHRIGHAVRCVRSEALAEAGWFGPGPLHPRLKSRIGTHTLLLRDDWTLRDWLPGERRYRQYGVHGGISKREMQVPLIVARV